MPKKGDYKKNAKPESVKKRKYNSKPEQKKRRAARNAARRKMEKAGKVSKGDGKDVDHKDRNPMNRSMKNLRVQSQKKNRGRNK